MTTGTRRNIDGKVLAYRDKCNTMTRLEKNTAFNEVLERCLPILMRWGVNNVWCPVALQEYRATCVVRLHQAIHDWKPGKCSFTTYVAYHALAARNDHITFMTGVTYHNKTVNKVATESYDDWAKAMDDEMERGGKVVTTEDDEEGVY